MTEYRNAVAAITGAANGIGRALARNLAANGARLALGDVDATNLEAVGKELRAAGAEVLTEVFDVTKYEGMEGFAKRTFSTFGGVDYFFNNAGVISVGTIWEEPLLDWEWSYKVNVMGLVHGIKAFVPGMLAQQRDCRIINTASIAGLLTVENSPAYVASKFAALALSEVLELQLQEANAKLRAHVVCPAVVTTDLNNCGRHRAQTLFNAADPYYGTEDFKQRQKVVDASMPMGMPADAAAARILEGIEKDEFYILTHPQYNPAIQARVLGIIRGARPVKVKR